LFSLALAAISSFWSIEIVINSQHYFAKKIKATKRNEKKFFLFFF